MIGRVLLLGLLLAGADGPRGAAAEGAADRITLRDGSVVLGLVTATTAGPRASVDVMVRRDWAEKNLQERLARWDRATAAATRRAVEQRQKRLADWRRERERAPGVGPDDRLIAWIDRERARLANPGDGERSLLLNVRLPRSEVRALERRPAAVERLLRLAWLSGLPDPETLPLDQLKDALEARGYAVGAAAGRSEPAALDRLLPPAPESEATWLARRAATEVALDTGLRFLRFQDLVIPDLMPGQPVGDLSLTTAFSELKRLLDPNQGQVQPDPMAEKLQAVAARGRVGAVATRLAIAPDLSGVTVESTLWVRAPGGRWAPFGSRSATVRPDDLKPEEGRGIAADPQVQGAFRMVEGLGLGAIPPEFKERSLRIGAATQKALGLARSAFNQDLDALMLPVLEPARNAAARDAAPKADPKPAPRPDQRRRSVLGPPDR